MATRVSLSKLSPKYTTQSYNISQTVYFTLASCTRGIFMGQKLKGIVLLA